ncbi:hypothetical protein QE152_g39134 [Popillia japonica]|uniref:Uncharacterized protein n=1 Tax=Popillia japonica TaxID=7064 RepID=A0AAW1HVM4_POPJA
MTDNNDENALASSKSENTRGRVYTTGSIEEYPKRKRRETEHEEDKSPPQSKKNLFQKHQRRKKPRKTRKETRTFRNLQKLLQRGSKIERQERAEKRNNLILRGADLNLDQDGEQELRTAVAGLIRKELNGDAHIERAYKIGKSQVVVKNTFENKLQILRAKPKLLGKNIYMDSDLTRDEQAIQKKIRRTARLEQEKGHKTKIAFQKLMIDSVCICKWNYQAKSLKSTMTKN